MTNIGPESTQVKTGDVVIDQITIGPEIGLIAGTITRIIIEEEETTLVIEVIETIDPSTEIVVGLEREITRDGYRYNNNRSNYRRDNSDQRYRNRSVSQDCSRSRERDRSSSRESSQSRGGNQYTKDHSRNEDRRQGRNNTRDRENRPRSESRLRSSFHVSTNRDR